LLRIPEGSDVLEVHKIFTANDQPVIFCVNTLPIHLFPPELLKHVLDSPQRLEPFFDFLEKELGLKVEYYFCPRTPGARPKMQVPYPVTHSQELTRS